MTIPSQDVVMTKTCTNCHETKLLDAFYATSTARGRRVAAECKVCTRARSHRWREHRLTPERRAQWNAYLRDRRGRVKAAAFAAYGGAACACCGETEMAFLTIDHVENDGAAFRRAHFPRKSQSHGAGYWTYAWLAKHGYPVGFQVLCMNCNFGKRMNGGTCPHSVRRNDYPVMGVEPSGSKRNPPALQLVG